MPGALQIILAVCLAVMVVSIVTCCTPAQTDWKRNLSVDLSLDGSPEDSKIVYQSVGVSYPLWYGFYAATGVWTNVMQTKGVYWGISYSFAPFEKLK